MNYGFRYLVVFVFCLLGVGGLRAQTLFELSPGGTSKIERPLTGEAAFFYETTGMVQEQLGDWNFRLHETETASVNILREDGQYERVIIYRDFIERLSIFAVLNFNYSEKRLLQSVTERHSLFQREMKYDLRYDHKRQPVAMDWTVNDQAYAKIDYTVTGKDQLTETMTADEVPRAISKHEAGRTLTYELFDTSGVAEFRRAFSYNENGRLAKIELTAINPKLVDDLITYTYRDDERGNWTQRLAHHHATGRYKLTQRRIVYRDQLPKPVTATTPVGQWNCPTLDYVFRAETDGTFTIIDGQEKNVVVGSWKSEGWGRYTLRRKDKGYFSKRGPFGNNYTLNLELRPGRLILYDDDGNHYDFMAEALCPTDELTLTKQQYMRWKETLWAAPGKRAKDAIPADLDAAFNDVLPIAPGRFSACLDTLCGVVDAQGNVLIPFAYQSINLALPDLYSIRQNGKAGLIDLNAREILPPVYERVWLEPKIGPRIIGTRSQEGRYYYDLDAGAFIPFEKDEIRGLNDRRWAVHQEHTFVLCDLNFTPVFEEGRYFNISILGPDRYLAMGPYRYHEIIDANGEVIQGLPGFRRISILKFGYLLAETDDGERYALLDMDGKAITEPIYERLHYVTNAKKQRDLNWELEMRNAIAKYKKPNGEEGYLTGLGEERQ